MKRIMAIASMCIHHTPSKRSFMNEVTVVSLRVSLDRVIWREIENPFYLVWIWQGRRKRKGIGFYFLSTLDKSNHSNTGKILKENATSSIPPLPVYPLPIFPSMIVIQAKPYSLPPLVVYHFIHCKTHDLYYFWIVIEVVELLRGEGGPVVEEIRQKSFSQRSVILDSCDLEDYTCSNYLQDLNRHKELVMEWFIPLRWSFLFLLFIHFVRVIGYIRFLPSVQIL